MKKDIDICIKTIAHDNELQIKKGGYKSVADYIISMSEKYTYFGYSWYFDKEELDENLEPSEAQVNELKAYLLANYNTPVECGCKTVD